MCRIWIWINIYHLCSTVHTQRHLTVWHTSLKTSFSCSIRRLSCLALPAPLSRRAWRLSGFIIIIINLMRLQLCRQQQQQQQQHQQRQWQWQWQRQQHSINNELTIQIKLQHQRATASLSSPRLASSVLPVLCSLLLCERAS